MTVPLRLTTEQFLDVLERTGVGICAETLRRKIRAREIDAYGRPYAIPRRELEKFGLSLADLEALPDAV